MLRVYEACTWLQWQPQGTEMPQECWSSIGLVQKIMLWSCQGPHAGLNIEEVGKVQNKAL